MNFQESQLAEFRESGLCDAAEPDQDGGIPLLRIKRLRVPLATGARFLDAVLCPTTHAGYHTRLFFSENLGPFAPRTANWNPVVLFGATWFAPSWQGVSPDLTITRMVATHLQALR